jgi:hypothetical protein
MHCLRTVFFVSTLMLVVGPCTNVRAQCPAPKAWFPHERTPEPDFHAPASDCEFHQWSWQTFLWLTQATGPGRIRLLDLPTADELFLPGKGPRTLDATTLEHFATQPLQLKPRTEKTSAPTRFGEIWQAGSRGILVDQKGQAVYYATHVSRTFYQFVRTNRLFLKESYLKASPSGNFPVRSLAVKSSWRIVSLDDDTRSFFTTDASVHPLMCQGGADVCKGADLTVSSSTVPVKVALVGMHVVGVVEDHPECVWSTFEHDRNAPDLPDGMPPDSPNAVSGGAWTFYAAGTPAKACNAANTKTVTFDAKKNLLSPPTNVFRQLSLGGGEDDDRANIKGLNEDVHRQLQAGSAWKNYSLVGSVWFARGNNLVPGLDGPAIQRRVAGSVGLSNVTMETFTQLGRKNCFACHDTGERGDQGIPAMNMNFNHALVNGLLQRDDLARTQTIALFAKAAAPLKSYAEIQGLLNDFVKKHNVPIASAPYGAFWNKMTYKEFTEGNIPGVTSPVTGKPLKVLVVKNSRASNLIQALQGVKGSAFDPVEGPLGRLPPTGPFMHGEDIDRIADWIDRGCPNEP